LQGLVACFAGLNFPMMIFGVFIGIVFGALPGLNASIAIALFMPFTDNMPVLSSFTFLVAIFVGGVSGGLISAILINIPGTASSVATTFDGNPMVKRGEGAKALGTGVLFSFLGTLFGVAVLMTVAPFLARFALKFGPFEYFSIALFSLSLISVLAGKSMVKGLIAGLIGIFISMIGVAPIDGYSRFTFGFVQLDGGFSLVPTLVGMFAIPEIMKASMGESDAKFEKFEGGKTKGFGFSFREFTKQLKNFFVSALIGTGIGILPGIGGGTSNILAYATCKRISKHPEKFGTGIMDGVVASETANNATIGGAFVPLLALGIPGDVITAVLLGGFVIHGISPGPMIFNTNANLVYTIFASLIVANFIMLIVEYFGMRIFIKVLKVPQYILLPIVMMLCSVGAYSINGRMFDVWTLVGFGIIGYLLQRFKYPRPPIVLGYVLAEMVEKNLRRSLQFSNNDLSQFLTRPISAIFIVITVVILVATFYSHNKGKQLESEG
jgi:putative tricarboxylic transport membrane protein